jgi:hypothetical protein
MLEFEKQRRYIAWHTDVAAAGSIDPFNIHASKIIAGNVHQKCKARWYFWGIKYRPTISR